MISARFLLSPTSAKNNVSVLKENSIQCNLCPAHCVLASGKEGQCRVRFNKDGKPNLQFYGFITALAIDPIEKKPLYHFRPGTQIFSAGFAGCNLRCPFCQNWHISQSNAVTGKTYTPEGLIAELKAAGQAAQIAYTYSEPLVHIEFLLDCMKEARKEGIANVLVSNGCVNSEAAAEILDLTDAANIDLKCYSAETYSKILGGDLSTVLRFIRIAVEKKVQLELTTLVVPGLNDSEEELNQCRDFIVELQSRESAVPWHLSAYRPSYKWKAPATDPHFLIDTAKRVREKLPYVYTGNIAHFNDTLCPHCGKILVSRRGYKVDTIGLSLKDDGGKMAYFCSHCNGKAPVGY